VRILVPRSGRLSACPEGAGRQGNTVAGAGRVIVAEPTPAMPDRRNRRTIPWHPDAKHSDLDAWWRIGQPSGTVGCSASLPISGQSILD
jgi:hypothetical protein